MAVLDPLKLVITNYPEDQVEMMELENNPDFYAVDSYYQRDAMPRRTGGSGKQIWSTPIRPSALLLTLPIIKQGGFRIKQMR